jgi:PIN domain nuclease of toxin-antitoxin system
MARHQRRLNRAARDEELSLSAISAYEAALIGIESDQGKRHGRQAIKMHPTVQTWIRDAVVGTGVIVLPLTTELAIQGASLQAMHADPFDRIIVATAVESKARFVTADTKIIAFARSAGLEVLEL